MFAMEVFRKVILDFTASEYVRSSPRRIRFPARQVESTRMLLVDRGAQGIRAALAAIVPGPV